MDTLGRQIFLCLFMHNQSTEQRNCLFTTCSHTARGYNNPQERSFSKTGYLPVGKKKKSKSFHMIDGMKRKTTDGTVLIKRSHITFMWIFNAILPLSESVQFSKVKQCKVFTSYNQTKSQKNNKFAFLCAAILCF